MSADSTLTSKGQTTISKDIREALGMKSGDRMTFTMLPDGHRSYAREEQERHEPRGEPAEKRTEARSG